MVRIDRLHIIILIGVISLSLTFGACGPKREEVRTQTTAGSVDVATGGDAINVNITPPQGKPLTNYSSYQLSEPDRIVIEIPENDLAGFPPVKEFRNDVIEKIEFNRFEMGESSIGRIQVYLKKPVEYNVALNNGSMNVVLRTGAEISQGAVVEETLSEEEIEEIEVPSQEVAVVTEEPEAVPEQELPEAPAVEEPKATSESISTEPTFEPVEIGISESVASEDLRPPGDQVTDIMVNSAKNDTIVNIKTNGAITDYDTLDLTDSPSPRLVVDISGFKNRTGLNSKEVFDDRVERLRLGAHPDKIRIVFDLMDNEISIKNISPTSDGIRIVISPELDDTSAAMMEKTEGMSEASAPITVPEETAMAKPEDEEPVVLPIEEEPKQEKKPSKISFVSDASAQEASSVETSKIVDLIVEPMADLDQLRLVISGPKPGYEVMQSRYNEQPALELTLFNSANALGSEEFRINTDFIKTVAFQPINGIMKCWVIPNKEIIPPYEVLQEGNQIKIRFMSNGKPIASAPVSAEEEPLEVIPLETTTPTTSTQPEAEPSSMEMLPAEPERDEKTEKAAQAKAVTIEGVDFRQKEDISRVEVTTSATTPYEVIRGENNNVVLTLPNARIPSKFRRPINTSEFDSPILSIEPSRDGQKVNTIIKLREESAYVASQKENKIYVDFPRRKTYKQTAKAPEVVVMQETEIGPDATDEAMMDEFTEELEELPAVPTGMPAAPTQKPTTTNVGIPTDFQRIPVISKPDTKDFTGQKISLDFQDADIHNILRLIADVSNVNIIAGSDVAGRVTLKLKEVPWDQALEIILETNGLGLIRKGNIIRIAKREKILAEKELENKVEDTYTIMIPLNFASPKDVSGQIKGLNLLSPRGNVKVDDRTNRLIITDIRKNLEAIKSLVADLDLPIPQVLIESRIVEVNRVYAKDLGIQWGGQYKADTAHGNALPYDFPNSMNVKGDAGANYAINLPGAAAQGLGGALAFTFGHIADTLTLDLRLSAMEQSGNGRVVSSPRVVTLNKKEATISQGTEIPYSTRTAEGTKVQFKKAELSLKVTPTVNANKSIILKINAEKNAPDNTIQSYEGVPAISTKEAKTEILVNDGETTVIGGIFTEEESVNISGVPVLTDIPIIGYLFRYKGESRKKQELLIFITPRILHNEEVPREIRELGITPTSGSGGGADAGSGG